MMTVNDWLTRIDDSWAAASLLEAAYIHQFRRSVSN